MDPTVNTNTLYITEALRPICPNDILGLRSLLISNPDAFWGTVKDYLLSHSEFSNHDINYFIDTCSPLSTDLTSSDNVQKILDAIKELQKEVRYE